MSMKNLFKNHFYFIFTFVFLSFLISCSSEPKSQTKNDMANRASSYPPKDPPSSEIKTIIPFQAKNLESLSERSIKVLIINNLPDSYLIKSKYKMNPPDFAIEQIESLQNERNSWFNENIVSICGTCSFIQTELPIRTLTESNLLKLMDKISLGQDVSTKELVSLSSNGKNDILWLILVSSYEEQRRGESNNLSVIAAISESHVKLRSYMYDYKLNKIISHLEVQTNDEEIFLYGRQDGAGQAKLLIDKMRTNPSYLPTGLSFDAAQFDDVYPYPPLPDGNLLVKSSFAALLEKLSPL